MSFGSPFEASEPEKFPRSFNATQISLVPIIAPFWADLLFTEDSLVYGRLVSALENVNIVQEVNPGFLDFESSVGIVITWFRPKMTSGAELVSLILLASRRHHYRIIL